MLLAIIPEGCGLVKVHFHTCTTWYTEPLLVSRQRVVPLSLSPLKSDVKKNNENEIAVWTSWGADARESRERFFSEDFQSPMTHYI